jgi:two-component system LytT family response regulator
MPELMKIRAIIVDDELKSRNTLRSLCVNYCSDKIDIVEDCSTIQKAVAAIKEHNPDLVFLDIQMQGENGFELFNYFRKPKFQVVFTTAHKDFAIQAIKSSAFDYLLKPINYEELKKAVSRFEEYKVNFIGIDRFKILTENINNQFTDKQLLPLSNKNGFQVVQANAITHCKSDGAYAFVYTIHEEFHISKSLKEMEDLLNPSMFLRVHKSFIVNKNYITSFAADDSTLHLLTGAQLSVSDHYYTKKLLIDAITK